MDTGHERCRMSLIDVHRPRPTSPSRCAHTRLTHAGLGWWWLTLVNFICQRARPMEEGHDWYHLSLLIRACHDRYHPTDVHMQHLMRANHDRYCLSLCTHHVWRVHAFAVVSWLLQTLFSICTHVTSMCSGHNRCRLLLDDMHRTQPLLLSWCAHTMYDACKLWTMPPNMVDIIWHMCTSDVCRPWLMSSVVSQCMHSTIDVAQLMHTHNIWCM